ncbi:protein TALPID3 [Boleophthalmus pectinirostris]|uniref:protein TALPID3 n=1 Tax=Boleophthalmus pectinirostris TaxID=150288 RepID=UPI00242C2694|nr:protein TALPID3 [Boleophthalmus pectinirostris]
MKKAVDSWISTVSKEIQVEVQKSSVKPDSAGTKTSTNRNAADRRKPAPSGRSRPLGTLRTTPTKPARTSAKPSSDLSSDPDLYLRRLYGKAAHEGQRRSLKRSPYLRLTSPVSPDPTPRSNRPRPRIVESVRGVKLKSCKTQTSPGLGPSLGPGLGPNLGLGPGPVESGPSFALRAIPLGRPRIDSSHRAPGEVTSPPRPRLQPQQEVTSPPKSPQRVVTSGEAAREGDRETEVSEAAASPVVNIVQSSPVQEEQEEAEFPGTHFLSVADMEQAPDVPDVPDGSEEVLELEGGPGPDPVQYQGPVFPPQPRPSAPPSAHGQNLYLGLDVHTHDLEERLVQWVEQQLMSKLICEMSRPPLIDPTHTPYDQSEPEERPGPANRLSPVQSEHSAASDINPADSGLQLEVQSGLNLDPEEVRGLVLEVLTEIVALFLGSRESQEPETGPRTEPGSDPGGEPEPAEPSQSEPLEVVTPDLTPVHTPPPASQTPPISPVATPAPTPPPPPTDRPDMKEDTPPEPVATPPLTPPVTRPDGEPPLAEEEAESETPPPPVSAPNPTPAPVPSPPPFGHISEGELLLSLRHLQDTHDDGCSFSSSLHELQDMDPDPPSVGQIRCSSILLNFITKMQQREPRPQPEPEVNPPQPEVTRPQPEVHPPQPEVHPAPHPPQPRYTRPQPRYTPPPARGTPRPKPEGSWGRGLEEEEEVSAGEIRDDLIKDVTNQERSPGQASPITGDVLEWTNQSAVSEGLLTSDLLDSHLPQWFCWALSVVLSVVLSVGRRSDRQSFPGGEQGVSMTTASKLHQGVSTETAWEGFSRGTKHHGSSPVVFFTCRVLHLSCSSPVVFFACRVLRLSCSSPVVFFTCRVLRLSCSSPVVFFACRVVHLSCSSPVVFFACRVLRLSCSSPVVFFACRVLSFFVCSCSLPVVFFVFCRVLHLSCSSPVVFFACRVLRLSCSSPVVFFTCRVLSGSSFGF